MKWKSIEKDGYPKEHGSFLVANEKGWMSPLNFIRSYYYPLEKVFVLYDPNYKETVVLDVTHYFEILMKLETEAGK